MSDKGNIEAILPLTEQQAAMLLYCGRPGPKDLGFLQVQFELEGALDLGLWRKAWEEVLSRHEALRMTIQVPAQKQAMAVCWKKAELPWETEDLRGLQASKQAVRIQDYQRRRRVEGLDLSTAPVMRLATFQLADERHHVEWCCHHLLLDGWSASIVLGDAVSFYLANAAARPAQKKLASSYRDYRRYLRERDNSEATAYWRARFEGQFEPLLICGARNGLASAHMETVSVRFSESDSRELRQGCTDGKYTANALLRGAWGLVLSQLTGRTDVVFGAVVSGRTAEFPGIDNIVGFLSNSVPVRLQIHGQEPAAKWVRELRDEQLRSQRFEDVPMARILAETPFRAPPFDSLLLIENLPSGPSDKDAPLRLSQYSSPVTSTFPLTLTVIPGEVWTLAATFDVRAFSQPWLNELLKALMLLLQKITRDPDKTLDELVSTVAFPALPDRGRSDTPSGEPGDKAFAPPRNKCELELVSLWQEVLRTAPIGIHDDFFDLGGRSLDAIKLFNGISDRFSRRLPPATLFQHPTIASMASLLREEQPEPALKCLVPIQTGGTRPRLFCIHAGGGHVIFYRELAQSLGRDFPVYGLQPAGLDGKERPLRTVEKMASRYLAEIRTVQASGPYVFVAHCFGAAVALEMAQQLRATEEKVSTLFLLDAVSPITPAAWVDHPEHSMLWNLWNALRAGDWTRLRWAIRFHTISKAKALWGPYVASRRKSESERAAGYLQAVQHICFHALYEYRPKAYPGSVVLLRSNDNEAVRERELISDWKSIALSLEVEQFPFDHHSFLIQPHVRKVAAFLASRVAES